MEIANRQTGDNQRFKRKLEIIKSKLNLLPKENRVLKVKGKIFLLGQVKSKLKYFHQNLHPILTSYDEEIAVLEAEIEQLIILNTEEKELTIKLTEEIISEYIKESDNALANYSTTCL
jgi:hypothetical protein